MGDESPRVAGRVLVGSDGSEPALAAARWAADWARLHDLGLTLVAVVPPMPVPARPTAVMPLPQAADFTDRVAEAARAHLSDSVAATHAYAPGVDVTSALVTGHPAATLAELSREAGLTVLGATGASGLRRALLGGTVSAVLHHAQGNVAVVPAAGGDPAGAVLVGLDIDAHAPDVAQAAIAAAQALDRPLLAVQAWDLVPYYAMDGTAVLMRDEADIAAAARESLDELTAPAAAAGVTVERVVRFGRAQDVLADLAPAACLLVVGSRGYGGFTGLLLGSVSRALTTHPQTPTLVVRM